MFLGDLQTKDVVNINDGKNLGRIVDVEIDSEGKIVNIVIEKRKFFKRFFNNGSQINIMYQEINKIGDDVILISV